MTPPPHRPGADLPRAHQPWDIPSRRALVEPLVRGPRPAAALITSPRGRHSNQYRALRQLQEAGYLLADKTDTGRKRVKLAPGQGTRLQAAIQEAGQPSTPVAPTQRRLPPAAVGLSVVHAAIAPDLIGAFADALEQQTTQPGLLGGVRTDDQSHQYLLLTDDEPGRSASLVEALRAAGASCAPFPVWPGMGPSTLRDHARELKG